MRQCEYAAAPISQAEQADRLATVIEQGIKTLAGALASAERLRKNA
jgi:hypothetical protein